jgi:hypothetical protein
MKFNLIYQPFLVQKFLKKCTLLCLNEVWNSTSYTNSTFDLTMSGWVPSRFNLHIPHALFYLLPLHVYILNFYSCVQLQENPKYLVKKPYEGDRSTLFKLSWHLNFWFPKDGSTYRCLSRLASLLGECAVGHMRSRHGPVSITTRQTTIWRVVLASLAWGCSKASRKYSHLTHPNRKWSYTFCQSRYSHKVNLFSVRNSALLVAH